MMNKFDESEWKAAKDELNNLRFGITIDLDNYIDNLEFGKLEEKEISFYGVSPPSWRHRHLFDVYAKSIDKYNSAFNNLRRILKKDGLTPKDIGTSEEELEQLWRNGCKTIASKQINLMYREPSSEWYLFGVENVCAELKIVGLTLADIGTSEEELKQRRRKTCKAEARRYFKNFQQSGNECDLYWFRDELKKGGFTLKDFETSEEELEQLWKKNFVINTKNWLKKLRSGDYLFNDANSLFLFHQRLKRSGFSIEYFEITEQRLLILLG